MKKSKVKPKLGDDLSVSEWVRKKPLFLCKGDGRYRLFKKQIKKDGFCSSELWALDEVISRFILPRLIRFREFAVGAPYGMETKEWQSILDEMIRYFKSVCNGEDCDPKTGKRKSEKGLRLFAKYFRCLWY